MNIYTTTRPTNIIATLTVALMLLTAPFAGVAAADTSDDDETDWLFGIGDDDVTISDRIDATKSAVLGIVDRVKYEVSTRTATVNPLVDEDDTPSVTELADEFENVFNLNNETLAEYVNVRADRHDINAIDYENESIHIEFEFEDEVDDRYIIADVDDDGNFENIRIVADEPDSHEVAHALKLEGYAAYNAADELDRFVDEYAEDGNDIDRTIVNRIVQQYAGHYTFDIEL